MRIRNRVHQMHATEPSVGLRSPHSWIVGVRGALGPEAGCRLTAALRSPVWGPAAAQ